MNIINFTTTTQSTIYTAPASTIVKVEFLWLDAPGFNNGYIHIDSTEAIFLDAGKSLIPEGDQLQITVSVGGVGYYGVGANIANRGAGYIPNYYYLTGGQALKATNIN